MRRLAALLLIFTVATCVFPHATLAQAWPSRPITIIVPWPAGALTDAAARILQPKLTEALGQPVLIEYRPGAGGVIGTTLVARAQPDGYTLLVTVNAPIVMGPSLQKNYPFDPSKVLSGVSMISETYLALVVNAKSPLKTVPDVVRAAKAKPGHLTFGSSGVGTTHQIAGGMLNAKAGIEITHVPFQGGGPIAQALLGEHIDMAFATLPSIMPLVTDGKLRLIALAEPKRFFGLPDVPTIKESLPGVETTSWVGMFAPAGTPMEIRERLARIIADALKLPEVKDKMLTLGMTPVPMGPVDFDRVIVNDLKFWNDAVAIAKIEKQ